jgi:transposase
MTSYGGLDVSLRSVAICVVDETGHVQLEAKVSADVDTIAQKLAEFSKADLRIGLEAGTLTQYLTHGLRALEFDVVCMEARQVAAALSAMRNKTDRNDARGIAQILRTGWYNAVHVKSMQSHEVRALLSSRRVVLAKCVDVENEIRGLLKVFGVRLSSHVPHGAYDEAVRPLAQSRPALMRALLPLLEARGVLYGTYLKLDNDVKAVVRADPVCRRLMTVPGVGAITALTFRAAVDDPTRFRSSRNVAAHFGLTPRRFQSGETDNAGHISYAGDADVRCALYTAAHALVTRSNRWCTLKAWGVRLTKTRGRRRAVIAVARKLAVILHRMWMDGSEFQWGSKEVVA